MSRLHPCLCPPRRVQLVSLCRFVGIQPFGTDAFLRSRLRRHLVEIKVGRAGAVSRGQERIAGGPWCACALVSAAGLRRRG